MHGYSTCCAVGPRWEGNISSAITAMPKDQRAPSITAKPTHILTLVTAVAGSPDLTSPGEAVYSLFPDP